MNVSTGEAIPSMPMNTVNVPVAAQATLGQRHATLTLTSASKRVGSSVVGTAYGAQIEFAEHVLWFDDPNLLGVIAYVLNVGTVRLRLPALPDRTPRLHALASEVPADVIALTNGVSKNAASRRNEVEQAQFVRRFVSGLRLCFGSAEEPQTVVDWYRQKLLPTALQAVPVELQVNTTLNIKARR